MGYIKSIKKKIITVPFFMKPQYFSNPAKNYKCISKLTFSYSTKREVTEEKTEKGQRTSFNKLLFHRYNDQPKRNLSVFGYNRGKLFVSIKKDFSSFIVNLLIISVFIYSVYTLAPRETISQRRKRIIRERLMKEYEITEQDLEMVEEFDDDVEK